MNERHLKAFLSTAECGSFNKAAQKLYIAPQSLIKQIDSLEEDIGVKLFLRTRRGLSLTSAGEEMRIAAENILLLSEKTRSKCRDAAAKDDYTIRLGVLPSLSYSSLPSLCSFYQAQHPNSTIIHRSIDSDPYSMILRGTIDLFIIVYNTEFEFLPDERLRYFDAFCITPNVVTLETHRFAQQEIVQPEELKTEKIYSMWRLQEFVSRKLQVECTAIGPNDIDISVMSACSSGGVVITMASIPYYGKPLKCTRLDIPEKQLARFVGLRKTTPAIQEFIEMAKEIYR
ncbi:MAG: LysR family transcriptional regulator [Clostridia bacterium]|nr:LysR family transcriptional regulator [Clostridia bacterium]